MGKLKPIHWVLIAGAAVALFLLIWARRTNILANLGGLDLVTRVSYAIAQAEGFYIDGSRPNRNHNPGDLTQDLTGKGVGVDSEGFIIYASDGDGFDALNKQVTNFFVGSSRYNPSMSILQTAQVYAPKPNPGVWANLVAQYLGVSTSTTWSELT